MFNKKNNKIKNSSISFKQMIKFYKNIKIPWILVILTVVLTMVLKEAELMVVPYTSKIMTGAISENGFLVSFMVVTIAAAVAEALQGGINEIAALAMSRNVRRSVWGKLLTLPMSFFDKEDTQGLVSRVTEDTTGAYGAIAALIQVFSVGYGLYSSFHKMYITYKSLALIMLSAVPVVFLTSWLVGKMQYKVIYITNNAISKITNFFGERLPNVMYIKSTNMEDEEYQKGVEANNERYKSLVKQERISIFMAPISTFAQYLNQIILLLVATALVRSGTMKMFQLVNLYNYFLLFMSNAMMVTSVWQAIKRSQGSLSTIGRIMDGEDEELERGLDIPSDIQDICFEDVSFSYDDQTQVLNNISFTIPSCKVTAIVGENGCGKSTILKLLERFNEVQRGTIRIGDNKLTDFNVTKWRDSIGYLFQGNQMIKGSIADNIRYGVGREVSDEEIIEAAKQANAYDFIMNKEDGFDTQISNFDSKCSGGELQRIAIARIILKNPNYLIMDEATSGIDTVCEQEVLKSIYQLMENKTVIMVTHDLNLIKKADHVVVLNKGIIESSGKYDQVLKESLLIQQFVEV